MGSNAIKQVSSTALCVLRDLFVTKTGMSYYLENEQVFYRAVEHRMSELGIATVDEYQDLLLSPISEKEWCILTDDLVVSETFFFRYPQQFELLRDVAVPECMGRRENEKTLNIWSAGCATGAEPYSMNVLLRHELATRLAGWQTHIVGTDLSERNLTKARNGLYTDWDLRDMSDDMRKVCFGQQGGKWRIRDRFREEVTYSQLNLVGASLEKFCNLNRGRFDIVLCRNVMIYFDALLTRKIMRLIYELIAPGGWLAVGHADPYLEIASMFSPIVANGTTIYRKSVGNEPSHVYMPSQPEMLLSPQNLMPPRNEVSLSSPSPQVMFPELVTTHLHDVDVTSNHPRTLSTSTSNKKEQIDENLTKARSFANTGEWDESKAYCRKVLAQDEFRAEGHFLLALVLEFQGCIDESIQSFKSAIYLERKFELSHYHLGLLLARCGSHELALRSLRNALYLAKLRAPTDTLMAGDGIIAEELIDLAALQIRTLERR